MQKLFVFSKNHTFFLHSKYNQEQLKVFSYTIQDLFNYAALHQSLQLALVWEVSIRVSATCKAIHMK